MMTPLQILINVLTPSEKQKIYNRIWREMTSGDGYQPFGYDLPTLRITCPEHMQVLESLIETKNLYVAH